MIKIIHCADLHLTADTMGGKKDYCLGVLDEIIEKVKIHNASMLLISGDLFDTFWDAENLRAEFRDRIAGIKSIKTVYLPGNHEEHKKKNSSLGLLDFGAVLIADKKPFQMIDAGEVELLCVCHQKDYRQYSEWVIPEKEKLRIALVHASVSGMDIYLGPKTDEFEQAGTIDVDFFTRFNVDYGALGHIHRRNSKTIGSSVIHYPGSCRVWREGEDGPHGVNLLTCDNNRVSVEYLELASAGQYRFYELPLSFDGKTENLDIIFRQWKKMDWIDIVFSGLVEDEKTVEKLEREILNKFKTHVRLITIERFKKVRVVPYISAQPLAAKFIALWKNLQPNEDANEEQKKIWLRAREIALEEIAGKMGAE